MCLVLKRGDCHRFKSLDPDLKSGSLSLFFFFLHRIHMMFVTTHNSGFSTTCDQVFLILTGLDHLVLNVVK